MALVLSTKNKDFFEQVYQVVRLIPSGRVTSYGAIANYLSVKSAINCTLEVNIIQELLD